jgi:heme/copper-type cytochrome/quinol oxidase subunit 4
MSLVALSVTCIFYAEHYFYQNSLGGDVFQPARYGMLTELAMAVMSLTAVLLALRSIGVLKRGILAMGLMVVSTLLSFWLMSSSLGTISHAAANYPTASKGAVAQKAQQMVIIETMSQSLEAAPDMQVLIFADEPYDFERVYSLPLFLDFYSGREVAFYLETRIPDELKPDELSQGLSDWLDGISLNGGWKISPIREFDSDKPTMCVYFGQLVESDYCDTTLGLDN